MTDLDKIIAGTVTSVNVIVKQKRGLVGGDTLANKNLKSWAITCIP